MRPDAVALPPVHTLEPSVGTLGDSVIVGSLAAVGPGEWAGRAHRHAFVELFWVSAGEGVHRIDDGAFALGPGELHVVLPGQLHAWHTEGAPDGTLVLFTPDFLLDAGGPVAPAATLAQAAGARRPSAGQRARVLRLLAELAEEVAAPGPGHEDMMRALVTALLLLAARMPAAPAAPTAAPAPRPRRGGDGGRPPASGMVASSAALGLARRLQEMARREPRLGLTVNECARRLGVTPGHLADAVSSATGRSPREILHTELELEARRLLARTELSCSQVAGELGFEDPSYFSRFFRRATGHSPSVYRRRRIGVLT